MCRKIVLAIAAIATLSTSSLAADLPASPPPYIPPPAYSWAGIYLGATAGFAQGYQNFDDLAGAFLGYPGFANTKTNGFAGGGTLGINFQAGSFVYGLETDINWLSNKANFVSPNGAIIPFFASETDRLNYIGTVRGRLGLAVDRTLLYFTAGLAYGNVNNTLQYNSFSLPTWNTPYFNVDTTRIGWVVGAGLEYALAPSWTIKGEALYADLGNADTNWISPPPGSGTFPSLANYLGRFNTSAAIIRAGLNYKFNWFAPPSAVVAKY